MPRYALIDSQTADRVFTEAQMSARKRKNYNFHSSYSEPLQRFLNVFTKGSYLRPHRHLDPPKPEVFVVLEGQMAFFIFDDDGKLTESVILGEQPHGAEGRVWGIDVQPGVWHCIATLTDRAVCFEAKPGPYSATSDKDFAPWAPAEEDAWAPAYLEQLLRPFRR